MPPDTATADLRACRDLLRAGSKSFSAASRLLPRRVRDPATALYAFCRVADDAIDADPAASEATVDVLRERLARAYAGCPDDSPVDRALARVVAAHRIPRALPEALLEGLAWDARGRRYETLDEVYAYAARVAGAVGAMMTVVMGVRDGAVLARACDLGVAMQLTNIARDVGEDARRGRIYLPLGWLREAGVSPGDLVARPAHGPALASVVRRLLEAAEVLYRRADAGVACLPPDCRAAIFAARLVYSDIGRVVARAGYDSVSRRAVVSTARKVWLLVRSIAARWRRPALLAEPALGPTEFLLRAAAEGS
jgi:phytoene synthase